MRTKNKQKGLKANPLVDNNQATKALSQFRMIAQGNTYTFFADKYNAKVIVKLTPTLLHTLTFKLNDIQQDKRGFLDYENYETLTRSLFKYSDSFINSTSCGALSDESCYDTFYDNFSVVDAVSFNAYIVGEVAKVVSGQIQTIKKN